MKNELLKLHQRSIKQFFWAEIIFAALGIVCILLDPHGIISYIILAFNVVFAWWLIMLKRNHKKTVYKVQRVLLWISAVIVCLGMICLVYGTLFKGLAYDVPYIKITENDSFKVKLSILIQTLSSFGWPLVTAWILNYNCGQALTYIDSQSEGKKG